MGRNAQVFDRLSIRTKLIAMVAAPLAVIVAFASLGFVQRRAEAAETRSDVARVVAIDAAQDLQHEIQREALLSVVFLSSDGAQGRKALDAQRTRTDEAAQALSAAIDDVDAGEVAISTARTAVAQMGVIDDTLRSQVDGQTISWHWAHELFRQLESSLPPMADRLADTTDSLELAAGARSLNSLARYASTSARAGTILAGAVNEGEFPEAASGVDLRERFDAAVDAGETDLAVVSAEAGAATRVKLRNQMAGGDVTYFADQLELIRATEPGTELSIDPARWTTAAIASADQLRSIAVEETEALLSDASDRVSDADQTARFFLAGALLAVLLAFGLAITVAASIARPVMSLTAAADRVATEQLPRLVEALKNPAEEDIEHLRPTIEHLEVGGGTELARLTESVNAIQTMAVHVATEQATMLRKGIGDMFINLARRNQGLLDRQLEYIDELEAQEDDPDQLEHLFKLDHMATRMRRNAESLLVLAGAEPSRRRGKPVPLTKVTLAAVGEIEHFARVDLLEIDECDVTSKAAADIAHLLSELMENATQFSPPDSRVEVVGHRTGTDGFTISISDQGIGMSADQLAEANALLARPPLLGLTLARTLGFIVVGRLAARHGIVVRLVASPAGGVTSIVTLPAAVLASDSVDLTRGSGPFGGSSLPDGTPTLQLLDGPSPYEPSPLSHAPQVSSILPPLEFGSDPLDDEPYEDLPPLEDPVPSTLAEAVPTGSAFDEGLDRVVAGDESPLSVRRPGPGELDPSIPVRPAGLRPSPFDAPEPVAEAVVAPAPVAAPSAEVPVGDPVGALPEARTGPLFGTPAEAPAAPGNRLFGPSTPPASTPAVADPGGSHLFRAAPVEAPPGAAPTAPPAPLTAAPSAPAPVAPLGGPEPLPGAAPMPVRAPAPPTPAPTAPAPAAPAPTPGSSGAPEPLLAGGAPAAASPAPAPAAPAAVAAGPELTAAGLVKRVPRRAGGQRAVPGSGGARAATTSTRSPEEVRSMLSRFHSGKQAAGQGAPGSGSSTPSTPGLPAHEDKDI